jgi:acetyl esterase/lipase
MVFPLLRLVLAAGLFLLSLMVVVPATHVLLWYVVILVTELGHWFSLASLGIIIWELVAQRRHPNFITLALGVVSLGLFLKPLVQATLIARKLPERLAAAFGEKGRGRGLPAVPLSDAQLWGLARPPVAQERELSFTTGDGSQLALAFYTDGSADLEPGIVVIHGGGWNSGNARQLPEWSRKLAALGFRVASVSYRLAPRYHWPAQKEDVAAGIAFLKAHASELKLDPTRLVLLGRSAGGQIALDVAYTLRDPAIRGCIASYPPTDMNFSYWTGRENDMLGSRPLVRALMGGPPASNPALYHDASPLDFVGPDTPPTLLIHGGRDEIVWVRHSERLRDSLERAGRPVFLLELPWATHGFDAVPRGPGAQLELYAMAWFLNAVLRGS